MTKIFSPKNHLIELAQLGKRLFPVWVVVPLAPLIAVISSFGAICLLVFNLAARMTDPTPLLEGNQAEVEALMMPQTAIGQMLLLITSFMGIYFLLWVWLRFAEERPFYSLGLERDRALLKFGRGFGLGFVMFALSVLPLLALGYFSLESGPDFSLTTLTGVFIVLLGWLVQGPAEELLFRGWMLPVISARYRLWLGIILSSVTFAFLHSLNPNLSLLAMLNLFLFGLFAAFYALFEGSIWGVFGLHAVWNWTQGNLFGLEVSGARIPGGSIVYLAESGPDWLTGGAFGPEGGLAVTIVLLAGTGIIWQWSRAGGKTITQ